MQTSSVRIFKLLCCCNGVSHRWFFFSYFFQNFKIHFPNTASSWTCGQALPDMVVVNPISSTILFGYSTSVVVPIVWTYDISPFYWNCWCSGFIISARNSSGSLVVSQSQGCPFRTSGVQTNSTTVSLLPNTASNPFYTLTISMSNSHDSSTKTVNQTFCIIKLPDGATPQTPASGYVFTNPSLVNLTWSQPASWGWGCGIGNHTFNVYLGGSLVAVLFYHSIILISNSQLICFTECCNNVVCSFTNPEWHCLFMVCCSCESWNSFNCDTHFKFFQHMFPNHSNICTVTSLWNKDLWVSQCNNNSFMEHNLMVTIMCS